MKRLLLLTGAICLILPTLFIATADNKVSQEIYDEDEYGPEAPIIWVKPVRTVIFNHKTHTMEAGLDCESCHDEIFEMEAGVAQEDENFTMQAMYDGESCGVCHDGDTAFAANTRCTTCHIGVRGHARLLAEGNGDEKESSKGH